MSNVYWRKRYQQFILSKVGYEKNDDFSKNMQEIKNICKEHDDITFFEDEFLDYLFKYYSKYKFDVSFDFYSNLAKVILLENEINGTLIKDNNQQYTFIVKDNIELLLISSSYL